MSHLPQGATWTESFSTKLQLFYDHNMFFSDVETVPSGPNRHRGSSQNTFSVFTDKQAWMSGEDHSASLHKAKNKMKPFSNADLNTMAVASMCT